MEKAWQESEVDYFTRSFAWPKRSSPSSYLLKTSNQLPQEVDYKSLEKLPKWGMIVDGVLYPLHPLEQYMKEKGGSYWPTPMARAAPDCQSERKRRTPSLECILNQKNGTFGLKTNPVFLEWLMGYQIEWTELNPLETQSCPPKLEKLFASCRALHKNKKRKIDYGR